MSFTRYGLRKNPFGEELANPLECLDFFVKVDGFGDKKPIIDAWADQQIVNTQFFLICGCTGTGRRSFCNYILDKFQYNYIKENPKGEGNVLRVKIKIPDNDHLGALHYWMDRLQYISDRSKAGFHADVKRAFEKEIRNERPPRSETLYQELLYKAVNELKANNRRLAAVFENVRNPKIFTLVRQVFDDPDARLPDVALVIFTANKESLTDDFGKLDPRPSGLPPIELRKLTGKEVLEFVSKRWEQVKAPSRQPFEDQALVDAFNRKPYPFRRVVEALEYILNRKIETVKQGDMWPYDQSLKLTRGEIFEFLWEFDTSTMRQNEG